MIYRSENASPSFFFYRTNKNVLAALASSQHKGPEAHLNHPRNNNLGPPNVQDMVLASGYVIIIPAQGLQEIQV